MAAPIPVELIEKYQRLDEKTRMRFDVEYANVAKDPTIALVCAIFCVYHFYMGQVGLGILMIITGGGFFIWWLVALIGAGKNARSHNLQQATNIIARIS
jgi:TM2 domain-containing membrane protein YozV